MYYSGNYNASSENCGLAFEHTIKRSWVRAPSYARWKPCQNRFLHPILVNYRKIRKYRQPNGTHQNSFLFNDNACVVNNSIVIFSLRTGSSHSFVHKGIVASAGQVGWELAIGRKVVYSNFM